jgi:hypothetical protein
MRQESYSLLFADVYLFYKLSTNGAAARNSKQAEAGRRVALLLYFQDTGKVTAWECQPSTQT